MRRSLAALCRWLADVLEPWPRVTWLADETSPTFYYGDPTVACTYWFGLMPPPFSLSRLPQGGLEPETSVTLPMVESSTAWYCGEGEGI